MHENVFCKGSKTIFTNKAFRMLTGLRRYNLLGMEISSESMIIRVSCDRTYARCPRCGRRSYSVHSHYERNLLSLPIYDKEVHIVFVARRFRCRNPNCECRHFTEQPQDLVTKYGRRTCSLNARLTLMSVQMPAMRCEAISGMLGTPISASTSLRLVRAIDTEPDRAAVRNICIDDFAFRKGMTYGSIIVDADTGKPLELLRSRDTAPVAEGLKPYVNVVTVTRDRGTSYARAISNGLPGAEQIADRFHLVANCGDHVMTQIRHDFQSIKREITGDVDDGVGVTRYSPTKRQKDRYYTMAALAEKGVSNKMIGELMGTEGKHVKRCLERGMPVGYKHRSVKDYASHDHIIRQGIKQGKQLKEIWQDLWNDGLQMNYITLLKHMHKMYPEYKSHKGIRAGEKVDNRKALKALAGKAPASTARSVDVLHLGRMHIYVCNPEYGINKRTGECTKDHILYNQAIAKSQTLTELREVIMSFRAAMKGKDTDALDEWIKKYSKSKYGSIAKFAAHLLDDISAVRNAVRFDYSNGIAEGFNNKIKALKREMYGRANKDLLEKKLIASAQT